MKVIVLKLATLALFAIALAGCSKFDVDPEKLLTSDEIFSTPIAITLPANDESHLYSNILTGQQAVGGLSLVPGCRVGNGFLARVRGLNFNGKLDQDNLILGNWATIRSIKFRDERYDCVVYNSNIREAASGLSSELPGASVYKNVTSEIYMPIAQRTSVVVTWKNQYETDIPGRGPTKIIAITCTYKIEPASSIKGVSTAGLGQCKGRWSFDNDTGKWTKDYLIASDPDFNVSAAPPRSDVRTFSAATIPSRYQDWNVACTSSKEGVRTCVLSMVALSEKTRTEIARLSITRVNGADILSITLPLNVLLTPGIGLAFGSESPRVFHYDTCNLIGCIVRVTFDRDLQSALGKSGQARILFADLSGRPVGIPFSLNGFSDALKYYSSAGNIRR